VIVAADPSKEFKIPGFQISMRETVEAFILIGESICYDSVLMRTFKPVASSAIDETFLAYKPADILAPPPATVSEPTLATVSDPSPAIAPVSTTATNPSPMPASAPVFAPAPTPVFAPTQMFTTSTAPVFAPSPMFNTAPAPKPATNITTVDFAPKFNGVGSSTFGQQPAKVSNPFNMFSPKPTSTFGRVDSVSSIS
jgi:hypothetical protein